MKDANFGNALDNAMEKKKEQEYPQMSSARGGVDSVRNYQHSLDKMKAMQGSTYLQDSKRI